MTTRRSLLTAAGLGLATGLAGCRPARPVAAVGVPDVIVAETTDGLAVLRPDGLAPVGAAVTTPDGAAIYTAGDRLTLLSTAGGKVLAQDDLPAGWRPRVTSADGGLVALTAPNKIMITDRTRERRSFTFAGLVEPDAFTLDGTGLFVLEWKPDGAPEFYKVRLLDLATGALSPLLTRAKAPIPPADEEQMRGEAHRGVLAPDRKVLYTLYTHQPGHQHTRDLVAGVHNPSVHAFVHTLDMEVGWAYCVDLPLPFGTADAGAYAAALSPDGSRLFVADTAAGRVAIIDTSTLTVDAVASIAPLAGGAAYALALGSRLYVAAGTEVRILDFSGTAHGGFTATAPVRGLLAAPDGTRLYAGFPESVAWLDPGTGAVQGTANLPRLTGLLRAVPLQH
ncbi:YncE family protein [Hamadaea tsunoensis]|uniref:YncE family protein n=1 Tax=Hamadaea tsunoensis TaxID=53368 RepID=UPI0004112BB7|nr:hypothetical protein [Hamadaea tsunoensis]